MSIADLFRPKWRHSNPVIRLKAVKNITKQDILAKVAKMDEDHNIRKAAILMLKDDVVLADIAINDRNEEITPLSFQFRPNFSWFPTSTLGTRTLKLGFQNMEYTAFSYSNSYYENH